MLCNTIPCGAVMAMRIATLPRAVNRLLRVVAQKLIQAVVTGILVTFGIIVLTDRIPGSPAEEILGSAVDSAAGARQPGNVGHNEPVGRKPDRPRASRDT